MSAPDEYLSVMFVKNERPNHIMLGRQACCSLSKKLRTSLCRRYMTVLAL